jgi:hypothetical protein
MHLNCFKIVLQVFCFHQEANLSIEQTWSKLRASLEQVWSEIGANCVNLEQSLYKVYMGFLPDVG